MNCEYFSHYMLINDLRIWRYKGLHLRAEVDDISRIDEWISKGYSNENIEKVLNHIHVYDIFSMDHSEYFFQKAAINIFNRWRSILENISEDYEAILYSGYGPEITFFLHRAR